MRRTLLGITILVISLGLSPTALGQGCGDINNDGSINVSDMVAILSHITMAAQVPGFDSARAELDGRSGITIGDAVVITDHIFLHYGDPLDCTVTSQYTFPQSVEDTVFLPFMMDIHPSLSEVTLPVLVSLGPDTRGFYLPIVAASNRFELTTARSIQDPFMVINASMQYGGEAPDTVILIASGPRDEPITEISRAKTLDMTYTRVEGAVGSDLIDPYAVDRAGNLRFAVEKNGDLYIPVVQYYQVFPPTPALATSETSLAFSAIEGKHAPVSLIVDFSSTVMPVGFSLVPSHPWIVIEDPLEVTLTSPVTVTIGTDATNLFAGVYNGHVDIVPSDPEDADLVDASIAITFTVGEQPFYTKGDNNCDGDVTIGDIALLIDCVFINPRPVPDCE